MVPRLAKLTVKDQQEGSMKCAKYVAGEKTGYLAMHSRGI